MLDLLNGLRYARRSKEKNVWGNQSIIFMLDNPVFIFVIHDLSRREFLNLIFVFINYFLIILKYFQNSSYFIMILKCFLNLSWCISQLHRFQKYLLFLPVDLLAGWLCWQALASSVSYGICSVSCCTGTLFRWNRGGLPVDCSPTIKLVQAYKKQEVTSFNLRNNIP